MKKFAAIVIVILLGGCDWISENQICQVPHSELYGMAWEEQLDKNGIIFSKKDGKICYPEKYSVKARRASFSAEEIYRGAAELAKTKPHRDRVISWLKTENREFQESLVNTDEYLIVVFSGSENQFNETKLMFNCLQYQDNCNE
ncbi:MAG: hypothetical protein N0E44_21685 [Candidatus Thiodiazotropha lotti]|nr:hypothetical protein [Candidatus Thiodiazotropha lotti]MCW4222485.1 hypothetical protein [Candidatus Thiodiazotropha lotti]